MDINQLVEIAPGVTKRLGECTRQDMEGAREVLRVKAIRHLAAAEALARGEAPKCDWRDQTGTYCENDAAFIRTDDSVPDDDLWGLCVVHAPDSAP